VRRERLLAGTLLAYAGSLVVLGQAPNLVLAAAALAATGACAGAFDLLVQGLLQRAVPDAERGRAAGVWVLATGCGPLGHLEVGSLAATLGAPVALTSNGLVLLAGAVVVLRGERACLSGGRRQRRGLARRAE
jgi:MFS family permease